MGRILLLACFLFTTSIAVGQSNDFEHQLNRARAFERSGQYDRALEILDSLESSHSSAVNSAQLIEVQLESASLHRLRGEFEKASGHLQKANEISSAADGIMRGNILNEQGNQHRESGNFVAAFDSYLKAVEANQQLGDTLKNADPLFYIGHIFTLHRDDDRALDFFSRALQLSTKANDKLRVASILSNIGVIYSHQGDFIQAEETASEAILLFDSVQHLPGLTRAHRRYGVLLKEMGEFERAQDQFIEALRLSEVIHSDLRMVECYMELALLSLSTNDFSGAQTYALKGYQIGKKIAAVKELSQLTRTLATVYEVKEDYSTAHNFLQEHVSYQEAFLNADRMNDIHRLNFSYQIEQTTKEIELLKAQNQLNQSIIQSQVFRQNALIIIALMLVIVASVGFISYRNKRKSNKRLVERNQLIESQKQEIESKNDQLSETLTELTRAQAQLIESEKMASLGNLIAGISHELNSPLGAIKASAEAIDGVFLASVVKLTKVAESLSQEEMELVTELLVKSQSNESPGFKIDRQKKRELAKILNEESLKNANRVADILISAGLQTKYERYLALFKTKHQTDIVVTIERLIGCLRNARNIKVGVDMSSKIVYALKSYSHFSHGETFSEVDITETIETVLLLYQNKIKQGIKIEKDFKSIPKIMCYPDLVCQVWTNIIWNSIQAMDNKGTIKISISELDSELKVSIGDNGPGIPDEIADKIFRPFFTTKNIGEGSGLGLDICQKIVEKHDGRIEFESQPGSTVFNIYLPKNIEENNKIDIGHQHHVA